MFRQQNCHYQKLQVRILTKLKERAKWLYFTFELKTMNRRLLIRLELLLTELSHLTIAIAFENIFL